jgi:hypothetical protein
MFSFNLVLDNIIHLATLYLPIMTLVLYILQSNMQVLLNIGLTMVLIFVEGFRNFWLIVSNRGCHQIDDILTH